MEPPRSRPPPPGREAQSGWGAAALLGRERQARELCPGVRSQPYVCETGHCCGETGCCIYYYELWWMLASFKLPAYEEVAQCPATPPPPYSAVLLGGAVGRLGSSTLTLTGSSEHSTSCSCESSCLTSPSSTSLSATEVSSPSEGEAEGDEVCSSHAGGSWEPDAPSDAPLAASHKHALFSSNVELFESDLRRLSDGEEGPDAGEESGHLRHRRLTGDSGIEVGRGQDDEDAAGVDSEEEAAHLLGKGAACSQHRECSEGGAEELAPSPTLPV
ncbi:WW domain-binding protein 1 isoform X2 [Candoia aspera]|uniref:WW domain-binding protein 1 isoform X2 n=1 Tax=Candoia aspera TaxID=51853 RepID=UPI002FD83E7B